MSAIAISPSEPEGPRQCWQTPLPLFEALHERYCFEVDAAANDDNHMPLRYWTARENGLACLEERSHRAWINPPYDNIDAWISAAHYRCGANGWFSALLLPVRTQRSWWHRYAMRGELWFFRDRIRFVPPPGIKESSPGHNSVLIVFDPNTLGRGVIGSLHAETGARL